MSATTAGHASLEGKVALVTGANSGIGRVTATTLAKRGAHVVLACRSPEKAEPVMAEIERAAGGSCEYLQLDLASLEKVRAAASDFLDTKQPLHILVNNAGLAGAQGLTKDGFELAFGVNHLGHFLFTEMLLDTLRNSAPARIVIVASTAHYKAQGIDFEAVRRSTNSTTGLPEYEVSKLANVLHAKELAARLAGTGVTTYSLHPGVVASNVWREVPWPFRTMMKWFMISNEEGAQTSLYCATAPELANESGYYYDKSQKKKPSRLYDDEPLIAQLYERSMAWTAA